jgi:N-methylhydantoinase A
VTDAAVVLGYIDPNRFAGGRIKLDKDAAQAAIGKVADQLGMELLECASGIAKVAEFQMADLIRRMTVGKGHDPRDFILFAFGGAGPVHAGVFARELGITRIVIPQRETASCWCAFGAVATDILHIHEKVDILASPFDVSRVDHNLRLLEDRARREMAKDGNAPQLQQLQFSLDTRHKGQIHEVEVALNWNRSQDGFEERLRENFHHLYEKLYGRSSSLRGGPLEIVTFRVRAIASTQRPRLRSPQVAKRRVALVSRRPDRLIYWDEIKGVAPTPIWDGTELGLDDKVTGPAVVETPDTAIVVRPGQSARLDRFGNIELEVNAIEVRDTRRVAEVEAVR